MLQIMLNLDLLLGLEYIFVIIWPGMLTYFCHKSDPGAI